MDAVKLLGSLLGSNATGGNLLGSLMKGAVGGGGGGGGLGSLLGGMLGGGGGGSAGGGATSGLLGSLMKTAAGAGGAGMLGSLLGGGGSAPEPAAAPPAQEVNDQATVLIRAMCNAAKSDGQIDETEQQNIIGRLGEIDQSEADFLRQEFSSPLDVQGFARSVPQELATQVYALSCATVKVDTREEVAYLQELGQALNLDGQTLEQVHKQLGLA